MGDSSGLVDCRAMPALADNVVRYRSGRNHRAGNDAFHR